METRTAKISIGKAGGTAGNNSINCKVSIPSKWVRELRLDGEERDIVLSFDGNRVIITKAETLDTFISNRKAMGRDIMEIRFYSGNTLTTLIYADEEEMVIRFENKTENMKKTAFGENTAPTWSDFEALLKSRCMDENSPRLKDYLMSIGLRQYDPVAIIKKSKGKLMSDDRWMSITKI